MLSASITANSMLEGQSSVDGGALQMREEDPWTFMPKIVINNQEPRLRSAHISEANNNQGGGPA
jgi:hypothetical protein